MMSHRMTVTEALAEAGGVLQTGNKSKVVVLRRQANGVLSPIPVNVSAIYQGKAPDSTYLVPGDQIIVPGNKLKTLQKIMAFSPILSFARIFTGGVLPAGSDTVVIQELTAREVVARCDGKTTMAEIAGALAAEYESSVAELENDIAECLDDLHRKKLIVFSP